MTWIRLKWVIIFPILAFLCSAVSVGLIEAVLPTAAGSSQVPAASILISLAFSFWISRRGIQRAQQQRTPKAPGNHLVVDKAGFQQMEPAQSARVLSTAESGSAGGRKEARSWAHALAMVVVLGLPTLLLLRYGPGLWHDGNEVLREAAFMLSYPGNPYDAARGCVEQFAITGKQVQWEDWDIDHVILQPMNKHLHSHEQIERATNLTALESMPAFKGYIVTVPNRKKENWSCMMVYSDSWQMGD